MAGSDAKNHIVAPQYTEVEVGAPRPGHPDFMHSSELRQIGFCGLRHNSLTEDYEIWLDGKIEHLITKQQRTLDPSIVERKWAEIFGLDDVETRD